MLRFYEISLGLSAWLTLISLTILSAVAPIFVAIFIVLFDTYWLLKTIYLFTHLRHSYQKLKQNKQTNWLEKLKKENHPDWEKTYHLVIIPAFKEPLETLVRSLREIKASNYPKNKIILVLALEERGGETDINNGEIIKQEFAGSFKEFLVTLRPTHIENELPGKASNQTFAAKEVKRLVIDKQQIPYESIITSVFDSDTRPGPEYFGILTWKFLNEKNPLRASYQPTPVFTNNIYKVSFLARILSFTCTFWQLMQQARSRELTTFSSHSMPWKTLVDVGFYDTSVVAEDSRIFFQCLIHFKGDYRVIPMEYPVYMDSVEEKSLPKTIKNLYKQQRRWAWGAENLPFVFNSFRKDKKHAIPKDIKRFWRIKMWNGLFSWSTSSFILFLFGWLPTVIGNREFQHSVLAYNLPTFTSTLMNLSVIGIIISASLSTAFLPEPPGNWRTKNKIIYLLEWVFTPIILVVLSGIPALDAQTRLALGGKWRLGFWRTPKHK